MATNLEETTVAAFSDYAAPKDLERHDSIGDHLDNTTVRSLSWHDVSVVVKDRKTKQPISILSAANGFVEAGQVVALMGPSGSGKTTLLNVLAHRTTANTQIQGEVMINNERASLTAIRNLSSYVEQEDALIGSLTVKETVNFAARLALPSWVTKKERIERVNDLLDAFGIQGQANALVGTPIRKGISGGQKRRLSVASQLIADPRILFLDEPTSGLDSAASFEVMNYIKRIAVQHRLIVVASIHQPSTATFALFDQLMLLSGGKTCYFGPMAGLKDYFGSISHAIPAYTNPAEFLLELVNVDFAKDKEVSRNQLESVHSAWAESTQAAQTKSHIETRAQQTLDPEKSSNLDHKVQRRNVGLVTLVLLHRSWIKSYRDVIAYGIRIAMYTGLAIMARSILALSSSSTNVQQMGTVWLRLSTDQSSIQPFINAIFFGSAFMRYVLHNIALLTLLLVPDYILSCSFMAVAYIPAALEDLSTFRKERANGLYGPLPFTLSNFLIGLPYLFLISIIFSVIAYWLSDFRPTAVSFWTWVMWLFLDLLAAEGLVVLVTCVAPIFVVALAVTAFANGLWMCVGGFMVPLGTLNVFWKYVFHYIDYQAYVFQGMMVSH